MKKIIAWLLVLTLTVAISIGATLAYLTDTDEDVNVMTLGNVKIDQLEYERIDDETADEDATVQEFRDNKPLLPAVTGEGFDYVPGDSYVDWDQIGKDGYTSTIWNPDEINNELDKMVFVKNKGKSDAYVRTIFAFEAGQYATLDEFRSMMHLNVNESDWTWEWMEAPVTIGESTYFIATATYNDVLAPGALTEISLSQIALDKTATNADVEAFGETYQILVKTQAIQTQGFDTPAAALYEGFGDVEADNIPWETDAPTRGIDLKTALHNLNGDTAQPITAQVTNVVFGLNSEYPEIVNNYDGTLVDVEQDIPVNAYYVNDGGRLTVYFLSGGTIYAPKDSNGLFRAMSKLTEVDVHNLDVSRVETMRNMFRECGALVALDAADWDTSKVTDMSYMFNKCTGLTQLSVDNWDTSNVKEFATMFQQCGKLTSINVANWDTGAATTMKYMFNKCSNLTTLPVDNWDTSKVENFSTMFQACTKLAELNVANWDTGSATDMSYMFNGCENLTQLAVDNFDTSKVTTLRTMFQNCYKLEGLNVGNWDTSEVTTLYYTFNNCPKLARLDGIGNWDTSKVTLMNQLFYDCMSLEELDVGSWDVSNVTEMSFLFRGCSNLKELEIGNWDTGNVTAFNSMFSSNGQNTGNMSFTELPVENWDMSSATNISYMFYGCGNLTELDLSNWDVSNVTTMFHLFADCMKMERYDFTGWNTESLQIMDGMFNSNKALKVVDVSELDTANVTDFDQVFDGCSSLEQIIGLDKWDTSKGQHFSEFLLGTQVTVLDLSSFDMSSAVRTKNMFHVNSNLTTIYVGDSWNLNPGQLTDTGMFGVNAKLTGANGSTLSSIGSNSAVYARVDLPAVVDDAGNVITEAVPGLMTHINDKA